VLYREQEMGFSLERGDITLCCNLGDTDCQFPMPLGSQVVLSSRRATPFKEGVLMLQPNTVVIIKRSVMVLNLA
jgi:hypothetical protein